MADDINLKGIWDSGLTWFKGLAKDAAVGTGHALASGAKGVFQGAAEGITGKPHQPSADGNDPGLLQNLTSGGVGWLKDNWVTALVSIFGLWAGKKVGDFVPGGTMSTVVTSLLIGGIGLVMGKQLQSAFHMSGSDTTPAGPVAKVNLPSVDRANASRQVAPNYGLEHPAPEPGT